MAPLLYLTVAGLVLEYAALYGFVIIDGHYKTTKNKVKGLRGFFLFLITTTLALGLFAVLNTKAQVK